MEDVALAVKHLSFPLFVKPAKAGDSLGVDEHSLVHNKEELLQKVNEILEEFGPLFVKNILLAANSPYWLLPMVMPQIPAPFSSPLNTFSPKEGDSKLMH